MAGSPPAKCALEVSLQQGRKGFLVLSIPDAVERVSLRGSSAKNKLKIDRFARTTAFRRYRR